MAGCRARARRAPGVGDAPDLSTRADLAPIVRGLTAGMGTDLTLFFQTKVTSVVHTPSVYSNQRPGVAAPVRFKAAKDQELRPLLRRCQAPFPRIPRRRM